MKVRGSRTQYGYEFFHFESTKMKKVPKPTLPVKFKSTLGGVALGATGMGVPSPAQPVSGLAASEM